MKQKVVHNHCAEKNYSERHWNVLKKKRLDAASTLKKIEEFSPSLYGSVARGDVHEKSDIDIVIPYMVNPFEIEIIFPKASRSLIQATKWLSPKAHLVIDTDTTITFPLKKWSLKEVDFYRFGGLLSFEDLTLDKRVPGINKQLLFIQPTKTGHKETSLNILPAPDIAHFLQIPLNVIQERKMVLERRDAIGRTGVYFKEILDEDTTFEKVLSKMGKKTRQTSLKN